MRPSTKKKIIGVVIPVVWLAACYFIGQHVNLPGRSVPLGAVQAEAAAEKAPEWRVAFHGAQEVDKGEIPWGITAGEIEMEDGTAVWLLTPDTSMTIEGAGRLAYSIHPWMAQTSDGARLLVGDDIGEQAWTLDVTGEWNHLTLVDGTYDISLAKAANKDGDWVILKAVAADERQEN
jgi:hypothetical protein